MARHPEPGSREWRKEEKALGKLELFRCDRCFRVVCVWDSGMPDDMPNACTDCWNRAHGIVLPTSAPQDQPPPRPSTAPAIWPLVIADMQARDAVGRERYGMPLQAFNGRNPLVDGYQESLDRIAYERQAIEERAAMVAMMVRLIDVARGRPAHVNEEGCPACAVVREAVAMLASCGAVEVTK